MKPCLLEISEELADKLVGDKTKRCPFLPPFMVRDNKGDPVRAIGQECMKSRCEIYDEEERHCSIPVVAEILKGIRR